jgi:tetratricopeptide (TPR) repeat protein
LTRNAHDNTLGFHAQVTGLYGDKTQLTSMADGLASKYPNNYLVAASRLRLAEASGDANGAVTYARLAVQCASSSSRAWHRLGHAYAFLAESLRRSRVIADMTQDELDSIFRVYPYWVACAKRATEIDPRLNSAWLDLSKSACFLGAEDLADSSFWKVAQQDPNDSDVIWWGLEMYQPKWLDDSTKLTRAVNIAVQARYENPVAGLAAADHIAQLGPSFQANAKELTRRIDTEALDILKRDSNDPFAHVALARIAERNGKAGDAFDHYLAAARRLPDTQDVLVRLADLASGRPQAPEVIEILKLAASHHSESRELQMAYGELLLYSARYPEAEKQFGEMAKRFPTDNKVKQRLAQAVGQQGRGAEAAKVFGEAARSEPGNSASAVARIQALKDAKLYDEAIAACRSILKVDPRNSSARWNLPELLTTKGEFEAALPEWRALLMVEEIASRKAIIQLSIAQCLKKLGRNDESMKAFAETLRLDPTGPYGKIAKTNIELNSAKQEQHANLAATSKPPLQSTPAKQPPPSSKAGTQRPPTIVTKPSPQPANASSPDILTEADSLMANGKRDEAKAAYQDALRRNPKLTKAHARLAWLLLMEKNWVEAEAELRKALAIAPDDPEANMWMASCMIFNGKKRESLPHLRKAVAPWQQTSNAYGSLLSLLLEFGMNDEAIARGKDAIAFNKNNTYFRRLLAQAYDQKGDQETALREYRTALDEDTYDVSKAITRLTVARLLWKMNRKDEARSEVQQVIDKGPAFTNAEAKNLLDSWK